MNTQSGTTGVALCASPKQSVIDAKITQVWEQIDTLHHQIANLQERLIPVVNPNQEVNEGRDIKADEPISPLADAIQRIALTVATANSRLAQIAHQLEL